MDVTTLTVFVLIHTAYAISSIGAIGMNYMRTVDTDDDSVDTDDMHHTLSDFFEKYTVSALSPAELLQLFDNDYSNFRIANAIVY